MTDETSVTQTDESRPPRGPVLLARALLDLAHVLDVVSETGDAAAELDAWRTDYKLLLRKLARTR